MDKDVGFNAEGNGLTRKVKKELPKSGFQCEKMRETAAYYSYETKAAFSSCEGSLGDTVLFFIQVLHIQQKKIIVTRHYKF